MYFQNRRGRYSFVYYDLELKKNRRLPSTQTPTLSTDIEAQAFCDHWNESNHSLQNKVDQKILWEKTHAQFVFLIEKYSEARAEAAPYSWQSNVYYLRYHVLSFFLSEKNEPHPNEWHYHFEDFRRYLQKVTPLKTRKKGNGNFSYSTMNGIIKSLNSFMLMLFRESQITFEFKCRLFEKWRCNEKTSDSVIPSERQISIFKRLDEIDSLAADMFYVCLHTGLRTNEALGISIADLTQGFPDSKPLKMALKPYDFNVHGFISLESQPLIKSQPRNEKGQVPRKPLKGKRRIGDRNSDRTIAIFDSECMNILIRRYNSQLALFQGKAFGLESKDYLLFDGLNRNIYSNHLRKAQGSHEKIFTPHDTRHTYSTWLAETTGGDLRLCKLILGHSSISTTEAYVHMGERIRNQLRTAQQLKLPMEPIAEDLENRIISIHRGKKQ